MNETQKKFLKHWEAAGMANLRVVQTDLLNQPWGTGVDAVILGANLMLNIVTDRDYKRAQKNLLERACDALKPGGRLLIDYDCPLELSRWEPANPEWVCFEGVDDAGTYGRYIVIEDGDLLAVQDHGVLGRDVAGDQAVIADNGLAVAPHAQHWVVLTGVGIVAGSDVRMRLVSFILTCSLVTASASRSHRSRPWPRSRR